MIRWRLIQKRRKRQSSVTKHYLAHKEAARVLVHSKLVYWNQFYCFSYNRVSIRNQRRSWGSCTSLGNLNFSYKLLFLPEHLQDYIIVHELCHLDELNHGKSFWLLIGQQIPEYRQCVLDLKNIDQNLFKSTIRFSKQES